MRRRDFISLVTSAAIVGPRTAIAQTSSKVFRLGTLTPGPPLDEKTPLGSILLKSLEKRVIRWAKISHWRRGELTVR
jgi:putative tryptophan/tyrosine transport system substrate-binding protein